MVIGQAQLPSEIYGIWDIWRKENAGVAGWRAQNQSALGVACDGMAVATGERTVIPQSDHQWIMIRGKD